MLVVRSVGLAGAADEQSGLPPVPHTARRPPHFEAAALVGGGILGATALILHARGHNREAYALGASGAILGGVIAALRLLTA